MLCGASNLDAGMGDMKEFGIQGVHELETKCFNRAKAHILRYEV